jgi:two-component system chemotaxis response regulator CheY
MDLMIVDDSMIIRNKITRALEDFHLNIVGIAKNGVEAVSLMKIKQPKIATMDLTMPEMDGIQCIEELIKIDPNMIILVVSALSDKSTAIQALQKGAHGFLCKPFTEAELTIALSKLINR